MRFGLLRVSCVKRLMSYNTFGQLFRVTTFGESHGAALGCVVDGCPARIPLEAVEIQAFLDLRRPGQSRFTTQRQEADAVKILSGVMANDQTGAQFTTGTPIALLIENTDQRSKDYGEIKDAYRPGHADYVYDMKYGFRDYRGGGRSSAHHHPCDHTATKAAATCRHDGHHLVEAERKSAFAQKHSSDNDDRRHWKWREHHY